MSAHVVELTDKNFDADVLKASTPVLVDFWAEWCMPCRFVAPAVEAVAKEYAGKIRVGKVDVDQNPDAATRYGINSIPTLLLFKNGKVVDSVIGALPKEQIAGMVEKHLKVS
jgi:thioredoxin 1